MPATQTRRNLRNSCDLLNRIDSILRKAQSLAIPPRSSRLRICCKMQIISSFHLCSDIVTASIHYFPTSKLLILSSATLKLALICLTAVINCTNSHLSTDVSFTTAIDVFCSVGHICYLIWFDLSFFSPHNWMAFVRLNKRHVMLCYAVPDGVRRVCRSASISHVDRPK